MKQSGRAMKRAASSTLCFMAPLTESFWNRADFFCERIGEIRDLVLS